MPGFFREKPLVSICIPTYNRCSILQMCLESLVNQNEFRSGEAEIVVSDNVSTDGTQALCRKYAARFYNFQYFRNQRNISDGNFPLAMSRGRGVLRKLGNDSLIYRPDSLSFLCATARKYQAERAVLIFTNSMRPFPEEGREEALLDARQCMMQAGYYITWIGCLSLWEEDCLGLEEEALSIHGKHFWQIEKTYSLLEKKGQGVVLNQWYCVPLGTPKHFEGQSVFDIFYTEWLQIVLQYAEKGCLTPEDVEILKKEVLCQEFIIIFDAYKKREITHYEISHIEDLQRNLVEVYADKPYFQEFLRIYRERVGDDRFIEYEQSGQVPEKSVEAVGGGKILVSICIPTYNRAPFLRETIESLVCQKEFQSGAVEIVVSDNASTDGTEDMCRKYVAGFCNFHYYRNEENVLDGNFPLALSRGRGLLRKLNNDTLVHLPGSLAYLCSLAVKYQAAKPVLVFTNTACKVIEGPAEECLLDIRTFILRASYFLTWIACLSLWEDDCENIVEEAHKYQSEHFWQMEIICDLLTQKGQGVIADENYAWVESAPKQYTGQWFFDVFYTEWLQVLRPYADKGYITTADVEYMKRQLLSYMFIQSFYVEKKNASYNISGLEDLKACLVEAYADKPYFQDFARNYRKIVGDDYFRQYENGGRFFGADNQITMETARETALEDVHIVSENGHILIGQGTQIGSLRQAGRKPAHVLIGNYCTIGTGVTLHGKHIIIGNDVWIGDGVTLHEGVYVHNGAVIEDGSVVTEDVPPYAVVSGIPAGVVRYRYSAGLAESLSRIKFWYWPNKELQEQLPLLASIEAFADKFDTEELKEEQIPPPLKDLQEQGYKICFFVSDYQKNDSRLDYVLEQYGRYAPENVALVVVSDKEEAAEELRYMTQRLQTYGTEKVLLQFQALSKALFQCADYYIAGFNYESMQCLDYAADYGIKIMPVLDEDDFIWHEAEI